MHHGDLSHRAHDAERRATDRDPIMSPFSHIPRAKWPVFVLGAAFALASCQSGPAHVPTPEKPTLAAQSLPSDFQKWLAQLRADARARGISDATVLATLENVTPIPRVVELDRSQPEFTQTFWRYFDGAVSDKRISDGKAAMHKYSGALKRISGKYGVPPRFLVAFWGLETNYGQNTGGYPVIAALVTLAYDGRRADFFRTELFNALIILDRGHITPAKMTGSWAGAMGQTQFMPSTFMKYAVDEDHDGHMDIWMDIPDALASAANYLKSLGWDGTRGWGREVKLPADFDASLASIDSNASETVKSLSDWASLGVKQADGHPLPRQNLAAALVLPAGKEGPAFLVYDNYRAILKWNRSAFYAIAVGALADQLIDLPPVRAYHQVEEPMRREDVQAIQDALHRMGFLKDPGDGVMGAATRQGVRAFQRANGFAPDGYLGRVTAAAILAQAGASRS